MERRLLTFIVASTAFFLCYAYLRIMFAPPVAEPIPAEAKVMEQPVDPAVGPGAKVADTDSDAESESDAAEDPPPQRPSRPQWITLGSMEPNSGHLMLVTLNSRGGGIERIELTERTDGDEFKYRRVDVFSGYLGYFSEEPAADSQSPESATATAALLPATGGVLVNVVGPGTPAAIAGVQVGDIITMIDQTPVSRRGDIDAALSKSKPEQSVSITLLRGNQTTPTTLQAILSEHPLDLVRLAKDGGVDEVLGNESRLSCLMTLSQVNQRSILTDQQSISGIENPAHMIWDATTGKDGEAQTASFDLRLSAAEMEPIGGKPVRLSRSYTLNPNSYTLDLSLQVENLADEPQQLAYRLEGANGITLEGWWYSYKRSPNWTGGAAARDIIYRTAADHHQLVSGTKVLDHAKDDPSDPNQTIFAPDSSAAARDLKYIAVDSLYFAVGYVPAQGVDSMTSFQRAAVTVAASPEQVPRHKERAVNTSFFLDSELVNVQPGGAIEQNLQLFAGPKKPELLEQYGLGNAVYYGMFGPLARSLAWLLHKLSAVGNYAVAIVLLTLIVRALMFPLSRKAAVNAQKMQELAPEMKKINDKYKDDMEGKMKAQRELQQRVGFNPLAGCLPMFLQLPIFVGLYSALSADIELRQAAVSKGTDWASNLAAPDMFSYWGDTLMDYLAGRGTGWLGPYFNILPVIVVVLFLAQQKMFMPPATDEQTRMTQKMMNIMTLMMGLFFFRVPAGLCIYFITSSLWGICERVLVKKTLPKGNHFDLSLAADTGNIDSSKSQKSSSLADRIRDQMAKPVDPVVPPNKRKRPKPKKR